MKGGDSYPKLLCTDERPKLGKRTGGAASGLIAKVFLQ